VKTKDFAQSDLENIREALGEELRGLDIFTFDSCSSTNTLAKDYAVKSPGRDAVFIARRQTAGVGRLGRKFYSDEGGLYISFLLHPTLHPREAVKITALAAVALCRVIGELTGGEPRIKWVNDVYLGGKKAAGILTVGALNCEGSTAYSVCGIGVNLLKRNFPPEIRDIATSVEAQTGVRADFCSFAARLIQELISLLPRLSDSEIIDEYRRLSFLVGRTVTVAEGDKEYQAKVVGITDDYLLAVRNDEGCVCNLVGGEVRLSNFV
jgi:BirA family biotin operon repressor/biotin-[acetyl-CoA-carboxylase] ligase